MLETVDTIARGVSALSAEKKVALNLPVTVPVKNFEDFEALNVWLSKGNTSNFVSIFCNDFVTYLFISILIRA